MPKLIIADSWIEKVCESQGINWQRTSRIIIDAKAGEPVYMYVTQFGDDGLLDLSPPQVLPAEVTEA